MDATGSFASQQLTADGDTSNEPATPAPVVPTSAPSARPDDSPASAKNPTDSASNGGEVSQRARPHNADNGGDKQFMFNNTLLAVVGAFGITQSVVFTVIAAVIALLVTLVSGRRK